VQSTGTSWRKWAFYGALIAAAYTAQDTYADLATKPMSLYISKFVGSIIAGAILGAVAAMVRNRYKRTPHTNSPTDLAPPAS
jgi:hypothetical protein